MVTDGSDVRYARGLPDGLDATRATMLYLEGGMKHAATDRYELLDLDDPRLLSRGPPPR